MKIVLSCLALGLLRAEEILVAAGWLADRVLRALGVARPALVHVHLVLDISLKANKNYFLLKKFWSQDEHAY
jgi:hypothetical protein